MEWLDGLKEKLFGGPVKRSGHLHHGPLERSGTFMKKFESWKQGNESVRWLAHYRDQLEREQVFTDTDLHLFNSDQATGVQIQLPDRSRPAVLQYLLEEFKDRVIGEGYRIHLSDLRIGPDGQHRERYYLKADLSGDQLQPPISQRFGNVLIENWGGADGPTHLKVLITVYRDRLHSPAESGMALINSLFSDRGRDFK